MTQTFYPASLLTPRALCILGMHRSGTSALAGLLQILGVDLGNKLLVPAPDNPKGFFEHEFILGWHLGLLHVMGTSAEDFFPLPDGWERQPALGPYYQHMLQFLRAEFYGKPLWGFKDPRACRLMAIWNVIFSALGVEPGYVLMIRNPDDVASSVSRRGGFPYNHALLSALTHMLEAERHTRGRRRVVVSYDQVLADWRGVANSIANALGLQWHRSTEGASADAREFLDPCLRHHGGKQTCTTPEQATAARGADGYIARCAYAAYTVLSASSVSGAPVDHAAMDRIAGDFRRAAPALRAWRPSPQPLQTSAATA